MIEVIVDNRDGTLWDISSMVNSLTFKTVRVGAASSVELKFLKHSFLSPEEVKFEPGNVLRIRMDDVNLFYGYIFIVNEDENESLTVTAYDQLRYLMTSDTYVFTNKTATEIIRKIASDNELQVGELAETRYAIPKMLEDGKKLMDIICTALDHTLVSEKQLYVLYDDFGSITLRHLEAMRLQVVVGEKSLLTSFSSSRSIDNDTYNQVKLVRDNKSTGKREVYMARDSSNIAKWGTLQYYEKADEGKNEAQIEETLQNLMTMKNREQVTLSLKALGYPGLRAGHTIYVMIEELGIEGFYVVNECSHSFKGDEHTMSLELVVY